VDRRDLDATLANRFVELDSLTRRVREVGSRCHDISADVLALKPAFPATCDPDGLRGHVSLLEEWIRKPLRMRNRQVLCRSAS